MRQIPITPEGAECQHGEAMPFQAGGAHAVWRSVVLRMVLGLGAALLQGEAIAASGPVDLARSESEGAAVPGAEFRVYLHREEPSRADGEWTLDDACAKRVLDTVVGALAELVRRRAEFPRFDESLRRHLLDRVVIEPRVRNREGQEFPLLAARTGEAGTVRLLVSAAMLDAHGYVGYAERLAPILAREFQWVVSKADTSPKPAVTSAARNLVGATVLADGVIRRLSGPEREQAIRHLFGSYLRTTDDRRSLDGQSYYEVGVDRLLPPTQPDSTTKFYDIRVREALQIVVREPWFWEQTPKAVRGLLNGTVWAVAVVKIDERDWATRTRVLSEDKAIAVGTPERMVQPATVLVNLCRKAAPEDPFFPHTKGLPMGALSAKQLATVIALELEHNLTEKSQAGHVAQDEQSAPK